MVRAAGQKKSYSSAKEQPSASLEADGQTVVVGVYAIFMQQAVGWMTSVGERQRPTGVNMPQKLVKLLAELAFPS